MVLNCSQALPLMNLDIDEEHLKAYFPLPKPVIRTGKGKLFKSIVTCLLPIHHHQLASESISKDTFCLSNEGDQICKPLPYSIVVPDPDGTKILGSLNDFLEVKSLFAKRRMLHALKHTSCLKDITSHPATWIASEDISLSNFPVLWSRSTCL